MPIRLMENFRAVFYAPYYATHALGFYKREGVEVELLTSDAPGDAVPKLIDGTHRRHLGRADAGDEGARPGQALAAGQLLRGGVARSVLPDRPQGARSRSASPIWRDMRFASVSEVPTPWMCLQQDLREPGIDPDKLPRFSDRAMTRNYHALQAGDIDVMQAFEPFVSMAEQDGAGDILYAASTRGPTAYTAFIATREACAKYRDEFAAMTRATAKMLAWLYANPAEELATAVATFFPDVPKDILARSLAPLSRMPACGRARPA